MAGWIRDGDCAAAEGLEGGSLPDDDRVVAGLPLDAWALLLFAVGLGLALELAFYRARRRDRRDT